MNDLWSFNINTNKWTWVSGNETGNQYGIYESLDESTLLIPGSRHSSISWIHNETLWLFGGAGYDNSTGN